MKQGCFYSVGVGPGDPELLTLKAVRIMQQCPVIAAPRTRDGSMLALDIASRAVPMEGKTILPLSFVMKRDPALREAAYQESVKQVAEYLDAGQDVAMLNLGDVSIYASCEYLAERLRTKGYETAMIPGVPSFCAVAAALNTSLTEMNAPLHILPGGMDTLVEELALPGSKVLMKSGAKLPQVIAALDAAGQLERSAMVQNCGLPNERIVRDLTQLPEENGYFSTIIVQPAPIEEN